MNNIKKHVKIISQYTQVCIKVPELNVHRYVMGVLHCLSLTEQKESGGKSTHPEHFPVGGWRVISVALVISVSC